MEKEKRKKLRKTKKCLFVSNCHKETSAICEYGCARVFHWHLKSVKLKGISQD